jgi:GNAT superfamily N-acetyltransferase
MKMINKYDLDFSIKTDVSLNEWPEWVRHKITVRLNMSDDPDAVEPVVATALVCRCIVAYDEGGKDTWDETQDLWDFHKEALSEKNVADMGIKLALCSNVTYIEDIEVVEEFRRKGVATHVLRVILDYLADSQGAAGLTLPKNNRPWLQKFYECFGFEMAGKTRHMIKDCTCVCADDDRRNKDAS